MRVFRAAILIGGAVLVSACATSSISDVTPQAVGTDAAQSSDTAGLTVSPDAGSAVAGRQAGSTGANQIAGTAAARKKARASANRIAAVSEPGSTAYKVGPFDVLDISVFKVPELSKSLQVSEAGTINYPLIGELAASGRTARQIEKDLTRKLGAKYLQNPQVTVYVKEHNSQRITMEGSVKKPGVYPIRGSMSLLQAIATANGMDKMSDETVVVFRTVDGKRSAARFDVSEIRRGAAEDPQLRSGDVVVAGKSAFKEGLDNVLTALRFTSVFALF